MVLTARRRKEKAGCEASKLWHQRRRVEGAGTRASSAGNPGEGPLADLPALRQAIAATHHLFQLLQPRLAEKPRRKLRRLSQRLLNIGHELHHLTPKSAH